MNYNKRIKITIFKKAPGYLDDEIVSKESKVIPCSVSNLSSDEQISIFGKYNHEAFKVYLKGIWEEIDSIEYNAVERTIFSKRYHRNSTVVIVA